MAQSIGPGLRARWQALSSLPGGKWLFCKLMEQVVPYTGRLGARVEVLEPGHCVIRLRERRSVRNHLRSVHAMALANLGEMVTGLALMNSLPDNARGILVRYNMEYLKKARGVLHSECHCDIPADNREQDYELTGEIRDAADDVVAIATARWRIGPERSA